jgi:hypothetical protein
MCNDWILVEKNSLSSQYIDNSRYGTRANEVDRWDMRILYGHQRGQALSGEQGWNISQESINASVEK